MASLKPKTVTFTKDEGISEINIYKYCSDQAIATAETYSEPVYVRDGDFGFPCIDGTGQVNFSPVFLNGYNALTISGDTANFKNFKTPYSTCKDKIYRLTKVTDDSTISLTAIDENALDSYAITYRLVIPADYSGALPTITEYRTNDAMIAGYFPKALEFVDNACVSKSYSKETGYPDKSESDVAQINFTTEWEEVEGYSMTVTTSAKNYKNFNVDGNRYQATKIKGDFEVIITIASTQTIYNVTYNPNTYSFSTDAVEMPAQIAEETSLTFAFYHQTNKANPTKDATCVPDGASGALPTAEACLGRISSVIIAGNPYAVTSDMIAVSGKKATVTIPAEAIIGDVVITLA